MKQTALLLPLLAASLVRAEESAETTLPTLLVYSPRVAVQEPTATFAMPVSALQFEPLVDVQARNLAEGQSDISIRGGTFENTGFKIGALNLYDPLTGHFFAEVPVAPSMLSAPKILTGFENAVDGANANTGTIAYQWRRIRTAGTASLGFGDYDTRRGELYQGWVSPFKLAGRTLAADASYSTSRSDGSRPFGESAFDRTNARIQLSDTDSQTDLFYGYQAKSFGWPNLYTPYTNIYETDSLQTALASLNHHQTWADGSVANAGVYYRRNKDHYVFNRKDAFNSAFPFGPSFHTAWVTGAGADGSIVQDNVRWNYAASALWTSIKSSSLNFGRHHAKDLYKLSLAPETSWFLSNGRKLIASAGASWDDSNRDGGAWSPLAKITLDGLAPKQGLQSLYVSFAKTTQLPTFFATNSRSTAGLFRGNDNLGRELAKTIETGITAQFGSWTGNAAVFYRQDDHLVDWTYKATTPNARAANAVDIDNVGFEAVARYETKPLELVLGYSALSKSATYATSIDASFYALNYPLHRFTAAVTARLGEGWEVRMDNEYRIQESNALRKSTENPFLSTIGLYYSPAFVKGLRLSAEVDNLWDSDFQEVPAVPAARRMVSVGATYAW